ncbi:MAG: hypothetical protein V4819_11790 [Verrucomicrobiota bacterium]
MKTLSPSLTAWVIVILSCVGWIGGVSVAFVYLLGLSNTAGWIIAAALGFSTTMVIAIVVHEGKNAVDLTDYEELAEFERLVSSPFPALRHVPKRLNVAIPSLRVPVRI